MKGYWLILKAQVTDHEAQGEYARLWEPIAERYQARINPLAAPPALKEARASQQVLVVEFPSLELAVACYDDPAYREAATFALRASDRELLILRGELA